ncbi:MAG: hypothetical protein ACTSP5_14450, partial [Candidatus Heimdallarchaeota archaeon]
MKIGQRKKGSKIYFILILVIPILFSVNFFNIGSKRIVKGKEEINIQDTIQKNTFEEDLNITYVGNYDSYYGIPEDIQISNDLVYVSDNCGDIQILTLDNNGFELVGYYKNDLFSSEIKLADKHTALCISGNNLFLALNDLGMVILNISTPQNPVFLSYYHNITADEVYAADNKLYTLKENSYINSTFSIYDVSTIQQPLLLFNKTYYDASYRMEIQNNCAFVRTDTRLNILNVTDPVNVTEIGHINRTIGGFTLHNNYLVLTN